MISPRLFLCSGAKITSSDSLGAGRQRIDLDSIGKKANVHIRFENVAKIFHRHLSPRLIDLLEIASYVYSADCATNRGKAWTDDDSTEPWGRDLAFVIPVREPDFWNSSEVRDLIVDVLTFLSNDKYSFTFVRLEISSNTLNTVNWKTGLSMLQSASSCFQEDWIPLRVLWKRREPAEG